MRYTKRGAACALALLITNAAPSRADEVDDARSVYGLGKAAYDRGDYQDALGQFSRAYALRPAPALLFNMAQASRLSGKGHCSEALELYERYLESDPAPENRTEVQERIVQMRTCAEDEARSASPKVPSAEPRDERRNDSTAVAPVLPPSRPSAPPMPPRAAFGAPAPVSAPPRSNAEKPPARHSAPLAAVLATGIGASLALAGGILYLRARAKFDEAKSSCPCPAGTYSGWETLTTASYALMATGVVVSGTGAAFWLFTGAPDGAETKVSGAGLRFSGRF